MKNIFNRQKNEKMDQWEKVTFDVQVESVTDLEAVGEVVVCLPYQELETSDGFSCTINWEDSADYAN